MSNANISHHPSTSTSTCTRLSERDRKVLNEYVNSYHENSALSQRNKVDQILKEDTSSINKNNYIKEEVSKVKYI